MEHDIYSKTIGGKQTIEKLDFCTIDDKSIQHAMERLNNRPRKTLGYATPNEVFLRDNNNMDNVALNICNHVPRKRRV